MIHSLPASYPPLLSWLKYLSWQANIYHDMVISRDVLGSPVPGNKPLKHVAPTVIAVAATQLVIWDKFKFPREYKHWQPMSVNLIKFLYSMGDLHNLFHFSKHLRQFPPLSASSSPEPDKPEGNGRRWPLPVYQPLSHAKSILTYS